jgi:hypothetical protein
MENIQERRLVELNFIHFKNGEVNSLKVLVDFNIKKLFQLIIFVTTWIS